MSRHRQPCCHLARWLSLWLVVTGPSALASDDRAHDAVLPPAAAIAPGVELPAGNGRVLRELVVHGQRILDADTLAQLAAPWLNRTLAAHDVEALRHTITRWYVSRGYLNSGAVYDEPAWQGDTLRLRIIEGRIDEIRVRGHGRLAPDYLRDRLDDGRTTLNLDALQARYQMLLSDPLIERLSVSVQPGTTLGSASLDVDVTLARPWDLELFADNYRSVSTGEAAIGLRGAVRNLTGYGDRLGASVLGTRGTGRAGLNWQMPLGAHGPLLSLAADHGAVQVIEAPLDDADIESTVTERSIGLIQTLVATPAKRVELGLSHDWRESRTTVLNEPFSFTPGEPDGRIRVQAWRFSQTLMQRWSQAVLAVRSEFTHGRNNIEAADRPLVELRYPDAEYALWNGQFQLIWHPPAASGRLALRGRAQFSDDRLVPLERLALGGHATVRGYRENTLVRDNGHAFNLEWHVPLLRTQLSGLEGFVFHDRGAGWNRDAPRTRLRSVGVGLHYRQHGVELSLAWAHAIDRPVEVNDDSWQGNGVHVALSHHF